MKAWQLIAISTPCLLAEETMHRRFIVWPLDTKRLRVLLTVNAGFE